MCTVTWRRSEDRLDLLFNRDELRTRGRAIPPTISQNSEGPVVISPTDSDAGGTWLGSNELGLTLCLLNIYRAEVVNKVGESLSQEDRANSSRSAAERLNTPGPRGGLFVSRGLLLRKLLDSPDIETVGTQLAEEVLAGYRSFVVLAFDQQKSSPSPFMFRWWGEGNLEIETGVNPPVSSSSFLPSQVVSNRMEVYQKLTGVGNFDLEGAIAYHRSHIPEKGPYSVCMHREDACTQSLSHVAVLPDRIVYQYASGSPCEVEFLPPVILPRKAS